MRRIIAVLRAQCILQPGGESYSCCHSHHKQQHLNKVCRSLFHKAFPVAQGQEKVPSPPASVRDFPIASYCSHTYDFRLLFVFNSGISIDIVKISSFFSQYFTWPRDHIFRTHPGDWKLGSKLNNMLKYNQKSSFSGIKVRNLSKKQVAPNNVMNSGAEPRYSELSFSFYLETKISLD